MEQLKIDLLLNERMDAIWEHVKIMEKMIDNLKKTQETLINYCRLNSKKADYAIECVKKLGD